MLDERREWIREFMSMHDFKVNLKNYLEIICINKGVAK